MEINGATIGFIAVLGAFSIPIVALVAQSLLGRAKQLEQREARAVYERIVREKLEVMKTALAMGLRGDELADLDRRLEQLVGADKLATLLSKKPAVPQVTAELLDADHSAELDRIARLYAETTAK